MSEQKKAPAKTSQPGTFQKILNWFKRLPGRIAKPFKNMWYELKKVSWPTKERLVSYSTIVLVFMLFMGVVIGLLDMGASRLVTAISSLKNTDTAEEAVAEVAETVPEVAENAVVEEATQTAEQAQTEAGSN